MSKYIVVAAGLGSGKTKVLVLIRQMICGTQLLVRGAELCVEYNGKMQAVVQFSKVFRKQAERYQAQGYVMKSARVRFVMGWTDVDEGKEYPIVLPDVCFIRGQKCLIQFSHAPFLPA